jgi:hypothetical protein
MELFKEKLTAFATILLVVLSASLLRAQIHDNSLTKKSDGGFNHEPIATKKYSHFQLTYGWYCFFPSSGSDYPIHIKDDTLFYTYKGNKVYTSDTTWVKEDDLVHSVKLRQESVDSIILLVKAIHDTEIHRCNFCVIDGATQTIDILYKKGKKNKKVTFEMTNTFDSTAYKIDNIINPYLLEKEKIYVPIDLWKEESDCDEKIMKMK